MTDIAFWLKAIPWILTASIKFLYTPPLILAAGYSMWETFWLMVSGGVFGTFVWYYAGDGLVSLIVAGWKRIRPAKKAPKPKKTFTKRNKLIAKTRMNWGLVGLAVVTPCIISIPVGTLLAARFYRNDWRTLPTLLLACAAWAAVLTLAYGFVFTGMN